MSRSWVFLVTGLALALCGCTGSAARPDRAAILASARYEHIPMLIYRTSWNSPNFGGGRMEVGVADFGDQSIMGVELHVGTCGIKGEVQDSKFLFLGGPFEKGHIYGSYPTWPVDYADPVSAEDPVRNASASGHMVIQSITLLYADGGHRVYEKDVSMLLAKDISNFCPNGAETGLPPSATIERH